MFTDQSCDDCNETCHNFGTKKKNHSILSKKRRAKCIWSVLYTRVERAEAEKFRSIQADSCRWKYKKMTATRIKRRSLAVAYTIFALAFAISIGCGAVDGEKPHLRFIKRRQLKSSKFVSELDKGDLRRHLKTKKKKDCDDPKGKKNKDDKKGKKGSKR